MNSREKQIAKMAALIARQQDVLTLRESSSKMEIIAGLQGRDEKSYKDAACTLAGAADALDSKSKEIAIELFAEVSTDGFKPLYDEVSTMLGIPDQ